MLVEEREPRLVVGEAGDPRLSWIETSFHEFINTSLMVGGPESEDTGSER